MTHARKIVLLVDDDREFISELEESLALSGYIPVTAGDGRGALKTAREIRPDVILLDLRLGSENGFAVAGRLRKDPATARIPVIMMSAYFGEMAGRGRGLPPAVDAYLNKPLTQKDIVRGIQGVLAEETERPFDLMKRLLIRT